jgi:NADH dehydrogenase FAD-containing subunit
MGKRLVLLGGGHAHMYTLAHASAFVEQAHDVVLVSPSPYHYYSGMAPGALGGIYEAPEIRFDIRAMVEDAGGRFLRDRAARIDASRRSVHLESGEELSYDVLSCNVGSDVDVSGLEIDGDRCYTVKPVEQVIAARRDILRMLETPRSSGEQRSPGQHERPARGPAQGGHIRVAVIGGGPAAVEIAGNLERLAAARRARSGSRRSRNRRTAAHHARAPLHIGLYASGELLRGFPARMQRRAEASLSERGIEIHTHVRVVRVASTYIDLGDGTREPADVSLLCTGVRPPGLFAASGLPLGGDGGMLVNEYLQSTAHPEIFGGGDCISFEPRALSRAGVYAVRENRPLFDNLGAALADHWDAARPFDPGGRYLIALNMGDGTGLAEKLGMVFDGRLAFRLKDRLDRAFMKRFQVPERSQETVRS